MRDDTSTKSEPAKTARSVRTGKWGGDHIGMQVSERGAEIEYDCAHGSIDVPLTLDKNGNFDLTGRHVREGPGPIRLGKIPTSRPARYVGRVRGQSMTLTVTLTDSKQDAGTFKLTFGREPRIRKCR